MREIFRYRLSVIGIIFGMAVAMVGMSCASYMNCLEKLEKQDKEKLSFPYQYIFTTFTYTKEEYEALVDVLKEQPLTIYAEIVGLYMNDAKGVHSTQICFSLGDGLNVNLVKGAIPTQEELNNGELIVILGASNKRYTYKKNNEDYIKICGDEYRVIGYCAGENTTVGNHAVILFADGLGQQTREDVWKSGETYMHSISINSNQNISADYHGKLCKQLEAKGIVNNGTLVKYDSIAFGEQYSDLYSILSYGISFSSVIIALIAIKFWLYQRRHEIALRRICGFTKKRIYFYISKDLGILFVIALVASIIMNQMIRGLLYMGFGLRIPILLAETGQSIGIMCATILLIVILNIRRSFVHSSLRAYGRGI